MKILRLLVLAIIMFSSCEKVFHFDEDGILVPLTVMEDNSLPSININGVKLHSEAFGNPSNPMLIAIHGGPGADYRGLLNFKQLVNDNMFVVFYDQRGSGLSQRLNKNEYSNVQVYIDELDAVISHYRQNSSQKIFLAGHSWGAMLATAYINQNLNDITGVILAEPGGFTWEQTVAYTDRCRELNLFNELTNDFVYQDQFITGSDHNTLDYKMALSTAGDVATGDIGQTPYWRWGAICSNSSINSAINNPEQMNFTTNLSNFTTKVLFVYSEQSTAYGLEHAELVSSAFPNVELVKILGCGHGIPHFGWNNFYPIIQNYLNELL